MNKSDKCTTERRVTDIEKLTRTLTEIGCQFEFNDDHDIDIYKGDSNIVTGALFKFNDEGAFMKIEFYTSNYGLY